MCGNRHKNKNFKKLAEIVHNEYLKGNVEPAMLIEKIEDDNLKNYVIKLTLGEYQISSGWDKKASTGKVEKDPIKYVEDTILRYQISKIEEQIKINNQKIENLGDDLEVIKIMKLNDELMKEKTALTSSK